MRSYDYDFYKAGADYVLERIDFTPEIGLILGSDLSTLADEIEDRVEVNYSDIPNFLVSTVKSHAGKLILGRLSGKFVVAMSGRFHYYEGYDFEQLAAPIRLFKLLGVQKTILTNAAGAINTDYNVGDIMIIKDHINLLGANPLRGPNVEEFGDRFYDIGDMYTASLRQKAKEIAKRIGQADFMREGVYYYAAGPNFESPAEIRAMRILGGDAVGMSTVTEALTAAHCKMPLLGLSLMSNMAAGVTDTPLSAQEVTVAAQGSAGRFKQLLRELVKEI